MKVRQTAKASKEQQGRCRDRGDRIPDMAFLPRRIGAEALNDITHHLASVASPSTG